MPAALVTLVAVVFADVRHFGFVHFDDPDYVTENPHVTSGLTLTAIRWAFTTAHASNWHPLTWLSHMLDVQVFGLNASAHHIVNVVFHAANAILLFAALRAMTAATWRSAVVGALFAVHPLHVESVAWVSERKDMLSTFFALWTLLAYAWYTRGPAVGRYILVVVSFAMGLLAKPMLVTIPFALLLLDYWPLRRMSAAQGIPRTRRLRDLVVEKLPLLALAAVSSAATFIAQRQGGAVGALSVYPLPVRVANAVVSYAAYLRDTVWPHNLSPLYAYVVPIPATALLLASVTLAAMTVLVLSRARAQPYLLTGWLWFLGTLVPVIGIVQVGQQARADRYTYVPLIGVFIMIVWAAGDAFARTPAFRRLGGVIAAALVLFSAIAARAQTAVWRDSVSLWERAVRFAPASDYAHYNLGIVLVKAGRVDDGMAHLREALRISPDYSDVHIDLGNVYREQGAIADAVREFETVVRLRPDFPEARIALGAVLRQAGRTADAVEQFRAAIRLRPAYPEAENELGNALFELGQEDAALAAYSEALRVNPQFGEAYNNRGAVLARQGRTEDALREFVAAVQLNPSSSLFRFNAALMLERLGRNAEAVSQLEAALRASPDSEQIRKALQRLTGKGL
jgi:tetratricopeptide (TPR) repeat protein